MLVLIEVHEAWWLGLFYWHVKNVVRDILIWCTNYASFVNTRSLIIGYYLSVHFLGFDTMVVYSIGFLYCGN